MSTLKVLLPQHCITQNSAGMDYPLWHTASLAARGLHCAPGLHASTDLEFDSLQGLGRCDPLHRSW